jgi:hypothetical protein
MEKQKIYEEHEGHDLITLSKASEYPGAKLPRKSYPPAYINTSNGIEG